jgi:alkaline phosphatase D
MQRFDLQRLLSTQIRRRRFLIGTGALTGFVLASQFPRRVIAHQVKFSDYPFKLGVASGDPLADSVVLWTRLAPMPLQPDGGMPPESITVQWQVAEDEKMRRVVAKGKALATPELGHSVHVEVQGLRPATWYWYQFKVGNEVSRIGRTRTLPGYGYRIDELKFAFASCQHWEFGYYTAYGNMAQEDLDLVFHLGDYIYEGPPTPDRTRLHANPEPNTLEEYRVRHAQYKTDPDLQDAHAAFPFICTWDDHEVDNDYADENSQDFTPIPIFLDRRAAAYQAYYEHIPLRPISIPMGPNMRLYRRYTFGDLAEFSVLDTRQYRTDQACDGVEPGGLEPEGGGRVVNIDVCAEMFNPDRTMLGLEQEQWLKSGLVNSRARWNVIAQQYLMAELEQQPGAGKSYWTDGWDGYFAERARLLEFIKERKIINPVTIGGDIHSFWVTDLVTNFFDDSDTRPVATEFVGTSITTPAGEFENFLPDNPHIKFFEGDKRGYVRCCVNRDLWTTDLRVVETINEPNSPISTLATFVVESGQPGAQRV